MDTSINPHIFRAYDIRGIVNRDITPAIAENIGKAFGTVISEKLERDGLSHKHPAVVVGRDNRFSSDELSAALIEGLLSTGCNVMDIGLTLTPILHYSVLKFHFDGGVIVTASHNDKRYNGFRFDYKNSAPFYNGDLQHLYEIITKDEFKSGIGDIHFKDVFKDYRKEFLLRIGSLRNLKVVIDCGNGAASRFAPTIFEDLGLTLRKLFCNLNGNFPYHDPDPEEKVNLLSLRKVVLEEGADLGIAFDTDGDRFGIVDEKGGLYENDQIMVLLARDILKRNPGAKIMFDIKTSYVLEEEIKKAGGKPIMFRTGHPYYRLEMLNDTDILLAGEVSGHTFIKDDYYGYDDGLFAAARLTKIVSQSNKPLSVLAADIPKTFNIEEIKLPCPDERKFKIVEEIKKILEKKYTIIDIDGVRVTFDKKSWALIRASNTEPAISIRLEAESAEKFKEICHLVLEMLEKYKEIDLSEYRRIIVDLLT